MYASCRCGTGCRFDAKIVKLGWHILWPCKMGEFEDGTCWTIEGPFCGTVTF